MIPPLERPSDLKKKIIKLVAAPERNPADLARALRKLHDIDSAAWATFLEERGIKRRRAYYLVKIDKQLSALGIRKSIIDKLGWTRLAIITPCLDVRNKSELLVRAEASSTAQLRAMVRRWKAGGKKKVAATSKPLRCVLLYFTTEQYEEFEDAIRSNGGERAGNDGLANKEAAIVEIIRQAKGSKRDRAPPAT